MAHKKSKFLRAKPGDAFMEKALDSGSRIGGTLGGLYLSNTILEKWTKKDATTQEETPVIPKKYRGPALFVLGMAAEIFIEQPQIESMAQGVQIAGAIEMMSEIVLKNATKNAAYGLAGMGGQIGANENANANDDGSGIDYDALYASALKDTTEMPLDGYYRTPVQTEAPTNSVDGLQDDVNAHKLT